MDIPIHSCGYDQKDNAVVTWTLNAQEQGARRLSCNCLDLPEIIDALGAFGDPILLARLALTSWNMCRPLLSTEFVIHVASNLRNAGLEWAEDCQSLEELALGFSVADLCASDYANHIYFPYGGGLQVRDDTRPLLHGAASLHRKHANLKIHIDAHVGAGAPSGIATSTSARRCESVTRELIELGVNSNMVISTAWGKRVSSVWDEPEDDRAARAELFFSIASKQFPKRKDYYNLVPENQKPAQQQPGADEVSSDDSEDEGNPLQRIRRHEMLHLLQVFGLHAGIPIVTRRVVPNELEESSDDDEDDEDRDDDIDLTPLLAEENDTD